MMIMRFQSLVWMALALAAIFMKWPDSVFVLCTVFAVVYDIGCEVVKAIREKR